MFKHMSETSCLESNTNYGVWSFKIEHVFKKAFGSMWLEVLESSQHYKKRTLGTQFFFFKCWSTY